MTPTSWRAGERIVLDFGPVTREPAGTPISLRTNGIKLRFLAKRSKDDTSFEIDADYNFTGGVANQNGIFVNDTALDNTGFVVIDPADTADIVDALYLEWELWLEEPGAIPELVQYDHMKISPSVRGATAI